MAIDYSLLALPKGTPRVVSERRKRDERMTALMKCYAKVDARDDGKSWVSGKQLVKSDRDHDTWLTRHHLNGRIGEHLTNHHGVITVSWTEHKLLDSSALIPITAKGRETTDARRIAGFRWNPRLIEPGKAPFRLKPFVRPGKAA